MKPQIFLQAELIAGAPELQQALHLWLLTNEPLVNRHFHDLDELEDVQAERSCILTGRS
jgi:hypothetical protein